MGLCVVLSLSLGLFLGGKKAIKNPLSHFEKLGALLVLLVKLENKLSGLLPPRQSLIILTGVIKITLCKEPGVYNPDFTTRRQGKRGSRKRTECHILISNYKDKSPFPTGNGQTPTPWSTDSISQSNTSLLKEKNFCLGVSYGVSQHQFSSGVPFSAASRYFFKRPFKNPIFKHSSLIGQLIFET